MYGHNNKDLIVYLILLKDPLKLAVLDAVISLHRYYTEFRPPICLDLSKDMQGEPLLQSMTVSSLWSRFLQGLLSIWLLSLSRQF